MRIGGSRARVLWWLFFVAGCGQVGGAREQPAARPAELAVHARDLVLVTIDTLRADAVDFLGPHEGVTPNLDALAARGVVFPFAHAHNVVTLPSHANILTGRLPYEHGVRDNQGFRLPESVPTLAEVLSASGFATAAFVAAYPLDAGFGLDRGFDLYDDRIAGDIGGGGDRPLERPGREVVSRALAWWGEQDGRRRFLWVHLFEPHAPYEPPEPFASRYAGEPYLGEAATADAALAPLIDDVTGEGSSTFLVVTADHGEALGDHGETSHGLFAYEATLHVPLLLWAPGLEPARSEWPARHVDIAPTLLAAAGVAAPGGLAGRSLLGPAPEAPTVTYFESLTPTLDRGWAPLRGVLRDREKYIDLPIPELYDLAVDPGERHNLLPAAADRAAEAAALLPAESEWPPRRGDVPPEVERSLRSLGYLGGRAPAKTEYGPDDDPKRLVDLDRKVHEMIALYHRGLLDEAAAIGREVLERRPDMGVAAYYLAQTELEAGRTAEALRVMEGSYRDGSATPALVRQLALTLSEVGRAETAVEMLRRAAVGGDPEDLNALGVVLSEAGDQASAEQVLQRVFAVDERNPEAWQTLALVSLRQGRWEEARDRAERALELNPGLGPAWSYLGSARFNLGASREALAAWRKAVEIDPEDFDALYNIGLVAPELGEIDLARSALERFLREAPRERYAADLEEVRRRLTALGGQAPN